MFVKLIVFTLFFSILQSGQSATYYFSNSRGVDTRSNQEAQNPGTPWQSVQKLNLLFLSLQAGDSILFYRGDIFHGTLEIVKSGSLKSPIYFGSYGSGEKPILTGFREIKDWLAKGKNIYHAQFPEIFTELNTVLIDNSLQAMGRNPKYNSLNCGYDPINSYIRGTIGSNELKSMEPLAGGEIVIRKNNWIIDRHLINSSSYNAINYDPLGSSNIPMVGYGFFIQNHPSTLDSHGEWFFDKDTKELLLY